jgi:hypothetical protein
MRRAGTCQYCGQSLYLAMLPFRGLVKVHASPDRGTRCRRLREDGRDMVSTQARLASRGRSV